MITDGILQLLSSPFILFIGLLPDTTLGLNTGAITAIAEILVGVNYILPVAGLLPILVISLALKGFQIALALIIRIKSFIPTMGA